MFLQDEIENNHDLIATYRHYVTATMNQANVSQFLRSYNNRNALEVERPIPGGNVNARTLKLVPSMTVLKVYHQRGKDWGTFSSIHDLGSKICFFPLRCPTLLVVGDNSPVVEAVVDCNAKLNPTKSTLLKVTESLKKPIKKLISGSHYVCSLHLISRSWLSFKCTNKTKVSLGWDFTDGGLWRTSSGGSGRLQGSNPPSNP